MLDSRQGMKEGSGIKATEIKKRKEEEPSSRFYSFTHPSLSHLRERCLSEDITQIPPSSAISLKRQTDRLYWERMESMGDNGCWGREGKRVANVLLVVCWSGRHALPFTSRLIFIITPSMIAVREKVLDLEQCLKRQSGDKSIESFLEERLLAVDCHSLR